MSDPRAFIRGEQGRRIGHCPSCGQPSDDDVCALAAMFRQQYPQWSSRRCFDRAWIAAAKGAKAERKAA